MDLMICVDSFMAHLSDILRKKTIVLLSSTRKGIYNSHNYVHCIESTIECSPCGQVADVCPRGLDQCMAFHHESITPEFITVTAINECVYQFNNVIHSALAGTD